MLNIYAHLEKLLGLSFVVILPQLSQSLSQSLWNLPGKPRNLQGEPVSEEAIQLKWDPPMENPSVVKTYKLYYYKKLHEYYHRPVTIDPPVTSYRIEDLHWDTQYYFRVVATSVQGEGISTRTIRIKTLELGQGRSSSPAPSTTTTSVPALCTAHQFQCDLGYCIWHKWVCDGRIDCHDASDETDCSIQGHQLTSGAIAGMSLGIISTMAILIVGFVFICRQRLKLLKRRNRERVNNREATSFLYNVENALDDGLNGSNPPPYSYGVDERAFTGRTIQLPKYDSVGVDPPAYDPKMVPTMYLNPLGIKNLQLDKNPNTSGSMTNNQSQASIPNAPLSGIGVATLSSSLFRKETIYLLPITAGIARLLLEIVQVFLHLNNLVD